MAKSDGKVIIGNLSSVKLFVLVILCLQNTCYTLLRRYSQGVLKESYSKHEVLLVSEFIKMIFSAFMIIQSQGTTTTTTTSSSIARINENNNKNKTHTQQQYRNNNNIIQHFIYLIQTSWKMVFLALIYGLMNILSYVALRNINAGTFTMLEQCKILSTAIFSTVILKKQYSSVRWRSLINLMVGIILFTEHVFRRRRKGDNDALLLVNQTKAMVFIGTISVLTEVTLSGFTSIYFEKVIKIDPIQLSIWERNFQLALGSFPIYLMFMILENGNNSSNLFDILSSIGTGWSYITWVLAILGAGGGLLVALAIKYSDSIVKTLATSLAIILSSIFDYILLDGPVITSIMVLGAIVVIVSICNYAFDPDPSSSSSSTTTITTSCFPLVLLVILRQIINP